MSKTKALAAQSESKLPQVAEDPFAAYAGVGLENVSAGDVLISRIAILQALSPQVSKRKAEYIEGAEPGLICDLGLGELLGTELRFLPVYYRKDYLEWAPRESGKGLCGVHGPEVLAQTNKDSRGRDVLPNGNYIAETAQFYGLNLSAGARPCFVPMASTQLRKARKLNTFALGEKLRRADGGEYTAPIFYRTYQLGVVAEDNNQGEWFGWRVDRGPKLEEVTDYDWRALLQTAVKLRLGLDRGAIRGDLSHGAGEEVEDAEAL